MEKLEQMLQKSDALADRAIEILNTFDERLYELEKAVLPVHVATRKLALLHTSSWLDSRRLTPARH